MGGVSHGWGEPSQGTVNCDQQPEGRKLCPKAMLRTMVQARQPWPPFRPSSPLDKVQPSASPGHRWPPTPSQQLSQHMPSQAALAILHAKQASQPDLSADQPVPQPPPCTHPPAPMTHRQAVQPQPRCIHPPMPQAPNVGCATITHALTYQA